MVAKQTTDPPMTDQDSPLSFPCDFPIKVMGRTSDTLEAEVRAIIDRHTTETAQLEITTRLSKGGKYSSITIRLRADSRQQLDAIYRDLTACEQVLMAL